MRMSNTPCHLSSHSALLVYICLRQKREGSPSHWVIKKETLGWVCCSRKPEEVYLPTPKDKVCFGIKTGKGLFANCLKSLLGY